MGRLEVTLEVGGGLHHRRQAEPRGDAGSNHLASATRREGIEVYDKLRLAARVQRGRAVVRRRHSLLFRDPEPRSDRPIAKSDSTPIALR